MSQPLREDTSHIAGTFLIEADGAFLNGAGLGDGEDRNVTIPKTLSEGRFRVPYVSAQAWKRWLRATAIQEAGWPASEPQAIGWNAQGNVNKIASQLDPVKFPEDDIFGYMHAQAGQGRRSTTPIEEGDDDDSADDDSRIRAVMRSSPFAASILRSLRSRGWEGRDEGFVHLGRYDPTALGEAEIERFIQSQRQARGAEQKNIWKRLEEVTDSEFASRAKQWVDGADLNQLREQLAERAEAAGKKVTFIQNATSPLPYATRFYNTHLQGIFCLNFNRLGVYWNVGDRVELEQPKVRRYLDDGSIVDVTQEDPYVSFSQSGRAGRIYRLADYQLERKSRAAALLGSLAVLRGGAKQAQFGVDIAPKALLLAGLNCGNPILNHLFDDDGAGPALKIETLKEIIKDYSDRITTSVFLGIRTGYLTNEADVRALDEHPFGEGGPRVLVTTPVEAAKQMSSELPPLEK